MFNLKALNENKVDPRRMKKKSSIQLAIEKVELYQTLENRNSKNKRKETEEWKQKRVKIE